MNNDTLHIEITYYVPLSKVWSALTDKDKIKEWYFDIPDFSTEKGAEFEFYKSGFKRDYLHHCKVVDVERNSLFKHTWAYPNHTDGTSMITWELIPRRNATSLRLTHEGVGNLEDAGEGFTIDKFESGWKDLLQNSLSTYLER